VDTPADASGRNRPGSVGADVLEYDANGNLIRKGERRFYYDFLNRLVRVVDGTSEVARYEYDAFNRRVRTTAPGNNVFETAWSGWQEIEEYSAGQLYSRNTFGLHLDEIVHMEFDLDLNGQVETNLIPIYDDSGNLAVLTGENGNIVGRYRYSPFGEAVHWTSDSTPPTVTQVLIDWASQEIQIEFNDEIDSESLEQGVSGGTITVTGSVISPNSRSSDGKALVQKTAQAFAVSQPVQTGREARRRVVVAITDTVETGTEIELVMQPQAVRDLALNQVTAPVSVTFTWDDSQTVTVLTDQAAPTVEKVLVKDGHLEINFSERVDPSMAGSAIQVNGASQSWSVQQDTYTLQSDAVLPMGTNTVSIQAGAALDLFGNGLAEAFAADFDISSAVNQEVYSAPDPEVAPWQANVNRFLFQGRPMDSETGLVYFRNRYYDPELGRFIQPDPLGYVDGPSMYQFAGYSLLNFGDPLGLYQQDFHYYVVYMLSYLAFGDSLRAQRIAFASQFVDNYASTKPLSKDVYDPDWQGRVLATWHFPVDMYIPNTVQRGPKNSAATFLADTAIAWAKTGAANVVEADTQVGMALHTYADSFSHETFTWYDSPKNRRHTEVTNPLTYLPTIGHGTAGTALDLPFEDPKKATSAAMEILYMLQGYAASTGSGRGIKFSDRDLRILLEETFGSSRGSEEERISALIGVMGKLGIPVVPYEIPKEGTTGRVLGDKRFGEAAKRHYWWKQNWNQLKSLCLANSGLGPWQWNENTCFIR